MEKHIYNPYFRVPIGSFLLIFSSFHLNTHFQITSNLPFYSMGVEIQIILASQEEKADSSRHLDRKLFDAMGKQMFLFPRY